MTMRRISNRSYPQSAPKDILLIPSVIEILEKISIFIMTLPLKKDGLKPLLLNFYLILYTTTNSVSA
jgi:hypothetical protein